LDSKPVGAKAAAKRSRLACSLFVACCEALLAVGMHARKGNVAAAGAALRQSCCRDNRMPPDLNEHHVARAIFIRLHKKSFGRMRHASPALSPRGIMNVSYRAQIDKALELLVQGLGPFLEQTLINLYGPEKAKEEAVSLLRENRAHAAMKKPVRDWDPAALLKLMRNAWNSLFKGEFEASVRSYVYELLDWRNAWAHHHSISSEDAYRILDTAERLLSAIQAPQAGEVRQLRLEVLSQLQRVASHTDTVLRYLRLVEEIASGSHPSVPRLPWVIEGIDAIPRHVKPVEEGGGLKKDKGKDKGRKSEAISERGQRSDRQEPDNQKPIPWAEVRLANDRILVLGRGGMGKSWLLAGEANTLAAGAIKALESETALAPGQVPVLLSIANFAQCLDDAYKHDGLAPTDSAEQQIAAAASRWAASLDDSIYRDGLRSWLSAQLSQGNVTLLLDAADEADASDFEKTMGVVNRLRADRNRVIVASRPTARARSNSLTRYAKFNLEPISSDEARDFAQKWSQLANATSETPLLEQLNDPKVAEMAGVPILLAFMCSMANEDSFPRTRGELLSRITDGLISGQWRHGSLQQQDEELLLARKHVLAELAYRLADSEGGWKEDVVEDRLLAIAQDLATNAEDPYITDAVLKKVLGGELDQFESFGNAFIRPLPDQDIPYRFLHRSIQEYLVAFHLAQVYRQDVNKLITAIYPHLWFEDSWEDTLHLIASTYAHPAAFIKGLLAHDIEPLYLMLRITADCCGEIPGEHPDREELFSLYTPLIESDDPLLRAYSGKALLKLGGQAVVDTVDAMLAGRHGVVGLVSLLSELSDSDPELRRLSDYAFFGRYYMKTFEELIEALRDEDPVVRSQAAEALGHSDDPRAVEPLLEALRDEIPEVRAEAAYAFGKLGIADSRVFEALIEALCDSDSGVRTMAAVGLWEIVHQRADERALEPLCSALLSDDEPETRATAACALGTLGDPRAVDALVQALEDDYLDVAESAAEALGKIRDPRAVDALVQALEDNDPGVRESAAKALGEIRDPRAVDALVQALEDNDPGVRESAAKALGEIRDPRAGQPLLEALHDEVAYVVVEAAIALQQIGYPEGIEVLIGVLAAPFVYYGARLRKKVIDALTKVLKPDVIDSLIRDLADGNRLVRTRAALALGALGDARAVDALVEVLDDDDPEVRTSAALTLGEFRDPRAVDGLIEAMDHTDPKVRFEAAEQLGNIGDPRAIRALAVAAHDTDRDVAMQAIEALGKIGGLEAVQALATTLTESSGPANRVGADADNAWSSKTGITTLTGYRPSDAVRVQAASVLKDACRKMASEKGGLAVRDALISAGFQPANYDINDVSIQVHDRNLRIPLLDEGSRFCDFTVQFLLGLGSYAAVYKVLAPLPDGSQAERAIKVVRIDADESRMAIEKEISVLSSINHPNVIRYFRWGRQNQLLYIEMELGETSLHDWLLEHPIQSSTGEGLKERLKILHDVALGLQAIHKKQVCHGDLKPANVVRVEENWKICDFGIARLLESGAGFTSESRGSLGYCAPEVFEGRVYAASDVFSFGILMCEVLTGKLPFSRENYKDAVLSGGPAMSEILDKALRDIVVGCLARDPANRPSIESVMDQLAQILDEK
jgi:HEAT repeat protein